MVFIGFKMLGFQNFIVEKTKLVGDCRTGHHYEL